MLGEMVLPEDCPHSKLSFFRRRLPVLLRNWVIEELGFIGRDDCVKLLRSFWNSRSINDLAQILEYSQFPKPMDEELQT
jgi:hypothetical protein